MKTWAVTFLRKSNLRTGIAEISGDNESDARRNFRECYRRMGYKILSVVEIPDDVESEE